MKPEKRIQKEKEMFDKIKSIMFKDNYNKNFNKDKTNSKNQIDDINKTKNIKKIEEKEIQIKKKYKRQKKAIYVKSNNKISFNSLLIIYLFFLFIHIKEISNYATEITITIEGTGTQPIIFSSKNLNYTSDQIILNRDPLGYTGTSVSNLINQINNITMIWNRQLNTCYQMFYDFKNIIYVDLSKFDSSQVTLTSFMFDGCSSLSSINFENFNTSSVISMSLMFNLCNSLISLDLSHFNTSSVTSMEKMFQGCESLKSLDLSNFDTSKIRDMTSLFQDCSSLISLNLNSFNTSTVINMQSLFYNCYSLTSLNLSNFNTSSVTVMGAMFAGCSSLISLDLSNFETSNTFDMNLMFSECSSLKSLNIANFNTSYVDDFSGMFYSCSSLISLDMTNFIIRDDSEVITDYMFLDCNFNLTYCVNDTSNSEFSSQLSSFNNDCFYVCSKNSNKKFIIQYNKCFDNCSQSNDYKFEYDRMCYEKCPNGTKPSLNNEFLCEIRNDETKEIRNDTSQECIIADAFNNKCKVNKIQENIAKNIKEELKNGTLDSLISNLIGGEKKDLIITENNMIYQITTSDNQNNKEYYNISTIRLGDCENILKIMNDIDLNETLFTI